ncbi:Ionotropic receptor 590 [Blattella germanica]|nr:Ionotropic receptor 590 [Blattella germanica]
MHPTYSRTVFGSNISRLCLKMYFCDVGCLFCRDMKVFLLVLKMTLASASLIVPVGNRDYTSMGSVIRGILPQQFSPSRTLSVAATSTDEELMNFALKKINELASWPVHVSVLFAQAVPTNHEDFNKIGNCIIFIKTVDDIDDLLDELLSTTSWSGRARFLVVVTEIVSNPQITALAVVQQLWEKACIANVVILVRTGDIFRLYSHFLYQSEQQCAVAANVELLQEWHKDCEVCFHVERDLFPEKVGANLHGCTLRVSTTEVQPHIINTGGDNYTGLEIDYLRVIQGALNFSVLFRTPSPGINYETHYEMLQDLQLGLSDLVIGDFPLHLFIVQLAEPTVPYIENYIKWYIPCAAEANRIGKALKMFDSSSGLTLLASFVMISFLVWAMAKSAGDEPSSYTSITAAAHSMFSMLINVAVSKLPRSLKLRTFVLLVIWYFFAIATVVQTILTSILVNPGFERQMTTLEELERAGIPFGSFTDMELLLNSSTTFMADLKLPKIMCVDLGTCAKRVILDGDLSTVTVSSVIEQMSWSQLETGGVELKICSLPGDVFRMSYTIYFAKGNPLIDRFNNVIRRMMEGGIAQKLFLDMKFSIRLHNKKDEATVRGEKYFVFGLTHLWVIFFYLLLGSANAALCLLLEMIFAKIAKLSPKKRPTHFEFLL